MRFLLWVSTSLIGFLIVIGVFAWFNSIAARQDHAERTKETLQELSSLAALQVDGSAVSSFKSRTQVDSPEFARIMDSITRIKHNIPGISECMVLRLAGSAATVIADSGRVVASDTRAGQIAYSPLDSFTPVPTEMYFAAISKRPQAEIVPTMHGGVLLQRAFAPIMDTAGNVQGILAISQRATAESDLFDATFRMLTRMAGFVAVLALCGFQLLYRSSRNEKRKFSTRWDSQPRSLRWAILDGAVVLAIILCLAYLRTEFSKQQQLSASLATSEGRFAQLNVQSDFAAANHHAQNADRLGNMIDQAESETQALREQLDQTNRQILVESMLLSLCAISLVFSARGSARRCIATKDLEREAHWHRLQHEQIASGLPIGFFTTESGEVVFTNASMDAITGRGANDDAHESFVAALHPDDKSEVLHAISNAHANTEAFEITFRVGADQLSTRTIEARGVPIFDPEGQSTRLVACALDITSRIRAQSLAESRQFEAEEANRNLRLALEAGERNFEATVDALVKAVEAKDVYTAGHSSRVMDYSVRIGQAMGLSDSQLRTLRMGTLIHDVGKIGIPDSILTKPGRLTQEEFALIRQHPEFGVRMIECIPAFADCIPIVLYHHERLDGRGYPFGLRAESLSTLVRIAAVADCFDAITSDRAYRKGSSPEHALAELAQDAERGALDGKIVATLADIVLSGQIPHFQAAA